MIIIKNIHEPAMQAVTRFSEHEDVRKLLVLRALASHAPHFAPRMDDELKQAMHRVVKAVREHRVSFDFRPTSPSRLNFPPLEDPLFMQALIYWCVRLDCGIEELVEAQARLGATPLVTQVEAALQVIRIEWEPTDGAKVDSRALGTVRTVPMGERPERPAGA